MGIGATREPSPFNTSGLSLIPKREKVSFVIDAIPHRHLREKSPLVSSRTNNYKLWEYAKDNALTDRNHANRHIAGEADMN